MKKFAALAAISILLIGFAGGKASSQAVSPTVCPVNYTCSLILTGTAPLAGLANDGQPSAIIGFVNFGPSSNISGILSINKNGTTVNNLPVTGTCTSGTATTLGQVQITYTISGVSKTKTGTFLTYTSGAGRQDLYISNDTSTTPADTEVGAGVCRGS